MIEEVNKKEMEGYSSIKEKGNKRVNKLQNAVNHYCKMYTEHIQ